MLLCYITKTDQQQDKVFVNFIQCNNTCTRPSILSPCSQHCILVLALLIPRQLLAVLLRLNINRRIMIIKVYKYLAMEFLIFFVTILKSSPITVTFVGSTGLQLFVHLCKLYAHKIDWRPIFKKSKDLY